MEGSSMKIGKKDIIVFCLFLLINLLFFWRFLDGTQIFAFKDLSRYFYPLRYLMVELVKAGTLPLWNPYIFCGFPLLATLQIGFFYPLSLIYYLLPFDLAFNYYIILHYFLAASFMYILLRYYELGRPSSFLGGIIFCFSGYLLSVSNMNTSLSSVVWLPLILLFFDRLLKKINYINVAALSLLLAVQFLGGEPTIIYVTLFFLMAYGIMFSGSIKRFFQNTVWLILSGLIALGLVAAQFLPFVELAGLSSRVVSTAYEVVTIRSFPPREILTFIFPYFYGAQVHFANYTEELLGRVSQDWLISPYLGILPLFLIFLSLRKKSAFPWFFAVTALVSLLLSFGKYTPLYRLVYFIPGISMIRYPVKYLFLTTFCLAVLASAGLQELMKVLEEKKEGLRKILKVTSGFFAVLLSIFIFLFVLCSRVFEVMAKKYFSGLNPIFLSFAADIFSFNLLSLFNIVFYLLALMLLLWAAYHGRIKKSIFVFLLILVVALDLLANGYPIMQPARAEIFSALPENYEILQEEKGIYRFLYTLEVEDQSRVIIGPDFDEALYEAKDNFAANWHIPHHFYDFFGYESIHPFALLKYFRNLTDKGVKDKLKFLSAFNVKYLISTREIKAPSLRLLRHKEKYGKSIYLYENKKALPRAYMLDASHRPDMKRARVELIEYQPERVMIRADSNKGGLLFLADAYYPGWKAYVDGKEERILRADEFFRAVPVPPGEHTVRFVYDPLSFKLGTLISSLALLGLAVGWQIARRRNTGPRGQNEA